MTGRGRTFLSGYTGKHRRLRAWFQQRMDNGETFRCWRCGEPILSGQFWDLGHQDFDRTKYGGPEHRRCNRATAGRKQAPPKRWGL
jgi:hypothetical protein